MVKTLSLGSTFVESPLVIICHCGAWIMSSSADEYSFRLISLFVPGSIYLNVKVSSAAEKEFIAITFALLL
jgi:hypothetical protein